MARRLTPRQAASSLRKLDREHRKTVKQAFLDELRPVRKEIRADYKKTRLGSKLWKRRSGTGKKIPILIKAITPKLGKTTMIGGVRVLGMAELIESGGRTRAHEIKSVGTLLKMKDGRVVRGPVRHPGGPVPRERVAEPAIRNVRKPLAVRVNAMLKELVRRVVG